MTPVTVASSKVSIYPASSCTRAHFLSDENLVVKKITLFATIFTRADGTETYYFNSQLFTKFM